MEKFLQLLVNGLLMGGLYVLVAIGIVVIYKSSGVLNLAFGQLVAIGGYFCWALLVPSGFPSWCALLVALALAVLMGVLIELLFLHRLIGQPIIAMVMMTISLGVFLDGILTLAWHGEMKALPILHGIKPLHFGFLVMSLELLVAFIVAMVAVSCLGLVFMKTKLGLSMRAVAEDHQLAQSKGIRVSRIFTVSWAISSIVAALAGILAGMLTHVSQGLTILIVVGLTVALFGGFESFLGTVIAGLALGAMESLFVGYLDPLVGGGIKEVFPPIALLIILLLKPHGLLGLARVERI